MQELLSFVDSSETALTFNVHDCAEHLPLMTSRHQTPMTIPCTQ